MHARGAVRAVRGVPDVRLPGALRRRGRHRRRGDDVPVTVADELDVGVLRRAVGAARVAHLRDEVERDVVGDAVEVDAGLVRDVARGAARRRPPGGRHGRGGFEALHGGDGVRLVGVDVDADDALGQSERDVRVGPGGGPVLDVGALGGRRGGSGHAVGRGPLRAVRQGKGGPASVVVAERVLSVPAHLARSAAKLSTASRR